MESENLVSGNPLSGVVIGTLAVMGILYFGAFYFGSQGYGYSGYRGYHRGPSFFYWGGVNTYHDPSARSGSIGGPGHRGGGTAGGK